MKVSKLLTIVMGSVFALTSASTGVLAADNVLPTDVNIVEGKANQYKRIGDNTYYVETKTDKTIATGNFDVAEGYVFQTLQPFADSVTLYRDTSGAGSDFFGTIQSNGKLFMVNPNGMVFGPNASINTNGFVASTIDISNHDFLKENYRFSSKKHDGSIVNQGNLNIEGPAAFVTSDFENQGSIVAEGVGIGVGQDVKVTLGDSVYLNLNHDTVQVDNTARFSNTGLIQSTNGDVYITTAANNPATFKNTGEIKSDRNVHLNSYKQDINNREGSIDAGGLVIAFSEEGDVYTGKMTADSHAIVQAKNIHVKKVKTKTAYFDAQGSILNDGKEGFTNEGRNGENALHVDTDNLTAIARKGHVKSLHVSASDIEAWGAGEGNDVDITNYRPEKEVDLYAVAHDEMKYIQRKNANLNVERVWAKNATIESEGQGEVRVDSIFAQNNVNIKANKDIRQLNTDDDADIVAQNGNVKIRNFNDKIDRISYVELDIEGNIVSLK